MCPSVELKGIYTSNTEPGKLTVFRNHSYNSECIVAAFGTESFKAPPQHFAQRGLKDRKFEYVLPNVKPVLKCN